MAQNKLTATALYQAWPALSRPERVDGFEFLQRNDGESFFLQLDARNRAHWVLDPAAGERRSSRPWSTSPVW
jgi:hypothetical protein